MLKRVLNTLASFVIMLCIGGVYAWSIVASELIGQFKFTVSESQLIFGTLIAVFPVTMIVIGRFIGRMRFRGLGYVSGILFFMGYYLAGKSQGNFILILLGIGVMAGIATGFGYWLSLTLAVMSFPGRKGLVTGIVTAGFGLGAVMMSEVFEIMLKNGGSILRIFELIGIACGLAIIIFSSLICYRKQTQPNAQNTVQTRMFIRSARFIKLILGIFLGTFAGLFVIGSLKMIGAQSGISNHYLNLAVAAFAMSNFLGRLFWGSISDYTGANLSIFLSLLTQAIAIYALTVMDLNNITFIITAGLTGMAFGGNFVLFARETSQIFGVENIGSVYPFVFLGYAIAGISSPMIGGYIYDVTGTFLYSILIAGTMSLAGSMMFLRQYLLERRISRAG